MTGVLVQWLHDLGGMTLFIQEVGHTFWRTRGNFRPIMAQVASVCYRSLPTILFSGVFVGAIMVIQFNLVLDKYGAQIYLGGLNTSAVVREVGPLIVSFLLAGKVGAYTAAELGTMRVTEQIDAVECLGTNPMQYLIVPRFAGIVISSIILLAVAMLISIGGAMFVAATLGGVNFLQFASSIPRFTGIDTMAGGLLRAVVYAFIVATVACYQGYTARGGAIGVGRAVTMAAVYTNFYIVIANFMTGLLMELIESQLGSG